MDRLSDVEPRQLAGEGFQLLLVICAIGCFLAANGSRNFLEVSKGTSSFD